MSFVRVCNDTGQSIDLPVEGDSTLKLSTVALHFPGVGGLKFERENFSRAVKLSRGKFFPPNDSGSWDKVPYYCVFNEDIDDFKQKIQDLSAVVKKQNKNIRILRRKMAVIRLGEIATLLHQVFRSSKTRRNELDGVDVNTSNGFETNEERRVRKRKKTKKKKKEVGAKKSRSRFRWTNS